MCTITCDAFTVPLMPQIPIRPIVVNGWELKAVADCQNYFRQLLIDPPTVYSKYFVADCYREKQTGHYEFTLNTAKYGAICAIKVTFYGSFFSLKVGTASRVQDRKDCFELLPINAYPLQIIG